MESEEIDLDVLASTPFLLDGSPITYRIVQTTTLDALIQRLREAEAEAEWLDEAIRQALDVMVGWDQINPAKTVEGRIERMAAILNKALEGSQTSQYRKQLERVMAAAVTVDWALGEPQPDWEPQLYGAACDLHAVLAAVEEK